MKQLKPREAVRPPQGHKQMDSASALRLAPTSAPFSTLEPYLTASESTLWRSSLTIRATGVNFSLYVGSKGHLPVFIFLDKSEYDVKDLQGRRITQQT